MPQSDYESERGTIEAGTGFEATSSDAGMSAQEQIRQLERANRALFAREVALLQTVRRLSRELAASRKEEAFLTEALDSIREAVRPLEREWLGIQGPEPATSADEAGRPAQRLFSLLQGMTADDTPAEPVEANDGSLPGWSCDQQPADIRAYEPGHNLGSWRYH